MKVLTHPLFLVFLIAISLAAVASGQSNWAETTATITPSYSEDTGHGYNLTYEIPESTAVNQEGQPVKGPVNQHVTGIDKPVIKQTIQLLYQKEEPVAYKLQSELKTGD